jgi:hypothetical protein
MSRTRKTEPDAPQPDPPRLAIAQSRQATEIKEMELRKERAQAAAAAIGWNAQPWQREQLQQQVAEIDALIEEVRQVTDPVSMCDRWAPGWRGDQAVPFGDAVNRGAPINAGAFRGVGHLMHS